MRILSYLFILIAFISCSQDKNDALKLNNTQTEEVKITLIETGEIRILTEIKEINNFFDKLNSNKREIVKFKPDLRIEVIGKNSNLLILYADGYIKHEGISYKLNKKLDF